MPLRPDPNQYRHLQREYDRMMRRYREQAERFEREIQAQWGTWRNQVAAVEPAWTTLRWNDVPVMARSQNLYRDDDPCYYRCGTRKPT